MFTFYYTPHTCSLASHIGLKDAGASYELKRIDFGLNEQQSPEYLKINPKARVPALVTPRGILTDTSAILAFIAQTFPRAALAPLNDLFAFAELQATASYLCSTLHVAHSHRIARLSVGEVTLLRSRICSAKSRNPSPPATK